MGKITSIASARKEYKPRDNRRVPDKKRILELQLAHDSPIYIVLKTIEIVILSCICIGGLAGFLLFMLSYA